MNQALSPPRQRWLIGGLFLAIGLQLSVLALEYLGAIWPQWTGQPIRLATLPVDPRSLFRGNYARLEYAISSIDASALPGPHPLRQGEVVYISLKPNTEELWEFDSASLSRPAEGTFVRGRVANIYHGTATHYRVKYGIEAWFAPKEKALALEREIGHGAIARVMVASSGKASLVAIDKRDDSKADADE